MSAAPQQPSWSTVGLVGAYRRWYGRQSGLMRTLVRLLIVIAGMAVVFVLVVTSQRPASVKTYHSSFDDVVLRAADIDWQRAKDNGDAGQQAAARNTINNVCVSLLAHPLTTSGDDRSFCRTYVAAAP